MKLNKVIAIPAIALAAGRRAAAGSRWAGSGPGAGGTGGRDESGMGLGVPR